MDLYRIDSSLRKSFSERTSHFQRADVTSTVPHHNDLSKFPSNDILSSSAWSAVIHQPDQDSDPEDLPSTVDIDAIKEPPTPINASAQTPAGQLHGDSHSFELSDEQNAGDSGSDSDSDSESGNSENENAASGGDSGSCSDSDSASSHPSSSSSKGKAPSSRSSRSNSPPSVYEDQRRQQFSVRETNFDEGGLKLKLSALRKPKQKYDDDSSDSSESKYPSDKKKSKFDNRLKGKKLYSLKARNDGKSKFAPFSRDRIKYDNPNDKDSDSDSSSSSNTSPEKSQSPWSAKARMPLKSNAKLEASIFRSIIPNAEYRNHTGVKDDKVERSTNHLGNKRNETNRNSLMSTKESVLGAHLRYRNMNRSSFISSSLKLPQACKLSEDSDESLESSRTGSRSNHKKENNRDTIEKLAQQLTQPGTTSDQLQVLNEEDLAAVLPDVAGATSGGGEFELTDGSGGKKKPRAIIESKKTASSDSSSDAELFPKQKQIVRDVINSIHVDSDASNDSDDSSHKQKSSNEESSSNDEDDRGKRNEKGQYSSNLLEAFAEQTDRLNKNTVTTKSKTDKTSGNLSANKKGRNDVTRKRGRPPKVKRSTKAKVEAYMRLDCVVSNVSPDSGIQSNSASPSYHSLHSPGIFNQNSRAAVTNSKLATTTVPAKPLSLSQKAVLSASQKNSHKRQIENNIKTVKNHREVPRIPTTESSNNKKECVEKKVALALKKPAPIKLANDTVKMSKQSSKISPTSTHADLALFQGKRGPGRPKKIAPTKVNGKTKAEKSLPLELEGPFEKTQDRKPATAEPVFKTKPKKMKYRSPVAMCLEGRKKRRKKKPIQAPVLVQPSKIPSVPPSLPRYPAHKEWLHKHKKRKKKENKEKTINLEFLKVIDELAEVFEKKCLIEDKKSSKTSHRIKEKSKKKKHTEKIKHSENESECDIASPLSITASITSSKRRHKKIAIEIPKISEATCDQRLPLKKRHYHVSASSITSNSHQTHNESKNSRSEKHSSSHSGDTICSSSTTPFETTAKPTSKVSNTPKTNVDVCKSKIDSQKSSVKADAQKHASKSDATKSASKSESNKISGKSESHKTSKSEPCKGLKNDSQKSETRKSASFKADNQKAMKNDSSKSSKTESKQDKETVDNNIAITPKKRLRVDEGKKVNQKHAANKTDSEALLPLRRSGRSVQSSNQKSKKMDSGGHDTKSTPEQKSSGGLKNKIDTEIESSVEKSATSKRNLRPQSNASKNSSKNDVAETSKSTSNSMISKTDMSKKEKSDTRGKENTPSGASSSNDMAIEKEPVDDGTGANDNASALTTPTKQPINKPQLITPLPSEPVPVNPSSANLKPPAGIFEPSRKLPSSLSKCKKTSIADVLSKLTEKLKDLDSPLKNTSALIEKIGVSKNDAEGPNSDRILRSKRTSCDGDNADAKKAKICKDMSIRLRKLSSSELSNSATPGTELKPKLKRRKTNKTGFPVKKKRKRMKTNSETSQMYDTTEETSIESTTEDEKTDATEEQAECPVGKVKHELIEEQAGKNENIENNPPNLQLADNAGVKVKCEVMSEDEITVHEARNLIKNRKKIAKSDVPNRLLPSRCSARIYIKQQIRAREMKKSKKKSANKVKTKKNRKRTNSVGGAKDEHPVIGKTLRPRECKNKDVPKNDTDKDTRSKNANDKDHRSKEETDKEEFSSDTESVKYQNTKKLDIPKWKRKYISAGLFSDFYKEEKHSSVDSKNRFNYKEEDHPHGLLPPPPYFDDWVRGRRVDFKLPFDLWWLHSHNQLPGRDDVVHSWNYKKIRTNVYYDVKPTYMYEAQACNCKMPTEKEKLGCGEDCINRMVYAECSPQLCPLKQKCSNQKIQKHEWASKLVKFMTRDKGWGVKTKEPIRNGDFILEYVGEVVSDKEFKKRMSSLYTHDIHHYCLNLDGGLVIDGHRMGGAGRFVNHSCEPNCEMQKWSVNGLFRMALFALRDIEAGEELTYDYNFALFNPAEGQPCLCGSSKCRGVIGGKSQRVAVSTASASVSVNDASSSATVSSNNGDKKSNRIRPRKQIRKNVSVVNLDNIQSQRRDSVASSNSVGVLPQRNMYNLTPVRPLTAEEKKIVRNFRVFLIRNLTKIQIFREKLSQIYNNKENSNGVNQNSSKIEDAAAKESAVFLTQLNALSTQRFIRTRRLAQAQDNPEMTKTAQLANVFRTIYNDVVSAKDEKGEPFSSLFMTLPSKRKLPMYYQRIGDPIDLTTIEKNIVTGVYKNVELFDKDMNKLIMNSVKYYGRTSEYGIAAVRLRKEYNIAKLNYVPQIKEIIGDAIPPSFMPVQEDPGDEEEDVIRCICGLYNDEGLMIQCERCLVWQHCDCVKADPNAEHYLCERCNPRDVDYEITLDIVPDYANPGEKHYLTLMRDDLQIRQGDTVYVLRDIPNPETGTRHSFRTIKNFKYEDCDIFRVERLWKNEKGERMSFGHHYLRPHETFHEPSRRFFPNEVVKVPLYETVPLDLIMGQCYVLDLHTYRKGRPIDSDPQHIYICEFRVDKAARVFFKMTKSKQYAVCTKNYAFDKYDTPLKPARTYAPHGEVKPLPVTSSTIASKPQVNCQKVRPAKNEENVVTTSDTNRTFFDNAMENSSSSVKMDEDDLPLSHFRDSKAEKQKQRLNAILLKLLAKKSSTKAPLDASYLLELGKRNRKKPDLFTT